MPRQVRIEYPGAIYHVMSRGNRCQDIYLSDVDRHDFLKTFAEACEKTQEELHRLGWQEADLLSHRKRDPRKVQIAVRLRQQTTLTVKQIAARLHLGTPASTSLCLLAAANKAHSSTSRLQAQLGL